MTIKLQRDHPPAFIPKIKYDLRCPLIIIFIYDPQRILCFKIVGVPPLEWEITALLFFLVLLRTSRPVASVTLSKLRLEAFQFPKFNSNMTKINMQSTQNNMPKNQKKYENMQKKEIYHDHHNGVGGNLALPFIHVAHFADLLVAKVQCRGASVGILELLSTWHPGYRWLPNCHIIFCIFCTEPVPTVHWQPFENVALNSGGPHRFGRTCQRTFSDSDQLTCKMHLNLNFETKNLKLERFNIGSSLDVLFWERRCVLRWKWWRKHGNTGV